MKALVVYFSRIGENSVNGQTQVIKKGFTEILAEKISASKGAPMFKIEPEEPYPFSYDECVKRSRREDETGERVPYLHPLPNLDEYDAIKKANHEKFIAGIKKSYDSIAFIRETISHYSLGA